MTDAGINIRTLRLDTELFTGGALVPDAFGTSATYRAPLEGWDNTAPVRIDVKPIAGRRGAYATGGELDAQTITINGHIIAPTPSALRDRIGRIKAVLSTRRDFPMVVTELGSTRHIMVRSTAVQKFDRMGTVRGSGLVSEFSIQLIALDPLKLSGNGSGPDVLLKTPTPGQAGSIVYVNAGDNKEETAPAIIRITGCTSPSLALGSRVQSFPGLVVPAGKYLTLDFTEGSAVLSGGGVPDTNARLLMSGRWLPLDEYPTGYTIDYTAAAYGATAQAFLDTYHSFT